MKKFDGNGTLIKFGTGSDLKVNTITMPGWTKDEIDDTNLGNAAVMTAFLSNLKKYNDMVVNADLGESITEGNQLVTITFPDSRGTFVCWADLKSIGDVSFANKTSPACDYTLLLTNRNATDVETAPVLTVTVPGA